MKTNTQLFTVLASQLYELLKTETYSESTIRDMNFILRAMSGYMEAQCLKEYTPEIGECFVAHCVNELKICSSRVSRAKNIVGKLNRLLHGLEGRNALLPDRTEKLELPDALMKSLADYLVYCAEEGNRQATIDYKYWICGRFLKNLSDLGYTEICEVTGEDVQAAFLALGYKRYWERVSPFLRFLYDNDFMKQNYSGLIQNRRKSMPLPTVYSPEEIICLENSLDLSSPNGIRNYAIILLMTRNGIRACDVAALTFDNIDFQNNRLHFIQQKTGDTWEGELLPEIKMALQNYIRDIRPNFKEFPNIFITLMPPYAPLNNDAINQMVVGQYLNAEINIAGRKHGSRAFRSSVASNMINDGVSTEIVRKALGHGTKHALKYYARIDVESMRLCPLPVPEPTGAFAEILSGKERGSHA